MKEVSVTRGKGLVTDLAKHFVIASNNPPLITKQYYNNHHNKVLERTRTPLQAEFFQVFLSLNRCSFPIAISMNFFTAGELFW